MNYLTKLLAFALALWAVMTAILAFLGLSIYFPFQISYSNDIPYHRYQTVRIAVFLTLAHYAVRYIIWDSRKIFPIEVLDIYVKALFFSGLILYWQQDKLVSDFLNVIFWFFVMIAFHFGSRPKYNKLIFRR